VVQTNYPLQEGEIQTMKIGIGIFAKTIGKSQLKTRLAQSIGKKMAEDFYGLSIKSVEEVACFFCKQNENNISIYWAKPKGDCDISTSGLSLGASMHKVANTILSENDAYILIGTDIPQLNINILNNTVKNLQAHLKPLIFGPCTDGGFYLMAGTFVPDLGTMESVEYSQSNTLAQLLSKLKNKNIDYCLIESLSDVDIGEDLYLLLEHLKSRKDLLLNQNIILEWLKNLA